MKKKLLIAIPIIALIVAGAVLYANLYPDYRAKQIAETYIKAWDSGKTQEQFSDIIKPISDQYFVGNSLKSLVSSYAASKGTWKTAIQKIFIIDKHNIGEQAVVYYTNSDSGQLVQANVILYRDGSGYKVHEAEIMNRSSAPIPKNAAEEEENQAVRYVYLQDKVKAWINAIDKKDEKGFLSYFATTASTDIFKKDFEGTQKNRFDITSTGILVLSSSDMEADVVATNIQTQPGISKPTAVNLRVKMAYDTKAKDWKISSVTRL